MGVNVQISDPVPVYVAPINEATAKWGVYCIPRMWRMPSGELVIRAGGEEDSCLVDSMQKAPNLYFISGDNGESWDGPFTHDIPLVRRKDCPPPQKRV